MPKLSLDKAYSPSASEARIYETWESNGYFTAPIRKDRKPFVIMIPPPNVTGMLTMGHVLNNSLQDILIRWHRMQGEDTLWLPGMDHAGIATQAKVEMALQKEEKLTRYDLGRDKLIERIWQWKEMYGGIILKQLRKLGASCDWTRERFTMDESLSRAVSTIFVHLYKKGLIYRGKRIVNWDPVSKTALSDEQVEYKNMKSNLWHIKYPLADDSGFLVVATTRPETMLGDTAIAVHPDDDRYKHLHGKFAVLPLVGRKIPIVADTYVEHEFGTGCVKVTPAHDPNDFEIAMRHDLEFITVIGLDATMTDEVPEVYRGLSREACRKLVVQHLEEQELMEKIEPYTHSVGHSDRSGAMIEPLLSEQWFVSMKGLAEPAIEAVREGRVRFHPQHWEKTYFHWLENVRDWCISRQIWWGHRIPLYTVQETGEIICSVDDPTNDPEYKGLTLVQDPDVLDTWFSSWLWPFSTLGWPQETNDLKHFFPTSVLITGPDIIFLWVARMIMASEEVFQVEPFNDVYFTGMVRDMSGRKMSKSLGNSPDPLDVIDKYGADALRFTVVSLTPRGGDIRFSEELCETGRNFANKIWNATRLILMNLPEEGEEFPYTPVDCLKSVPENLIDRWITSAFFSALRDVTDALDNFRFAEATKRMYSFIWNDFCDWYLELIKARLSEDTAEEKRLTLAHALGILDGMMRMLHPVMPFITEEIYQTLRKLSEKYWPDSHQSETIMRAPYPKVLSKLIDTKIEEKFQYPYDTVNAIRFLKSEYKIANNQPTVSGIVSPSQDVRDTLQSINRSLITTTGSVSFDYVNQAPEGSISFVISSGYTVYTIPPDLNRDSELVRLSKEMEHLEKLIHNTHTKLQNQDFLSRAKQEIIFQEQQKLKDLQKRLEQIKRNYEEIKSITRNKP